MISRKVNRGQGIEDRGKRIGSMSFLRKQESRKKELKMTDEK